MQMTTDARQWLDKTVRRILARHPLGDPERVGITYELMSHLHAAAEARATAAGRSEVSQADLEAALTEAGGEAGLAAAFVQPLAKPVERVLFWRRFGALAIDMVLVGIAITFVHGLLAFLLQFHMGILVSPDPGYQPGWMTLFPLGYHDPTLPVPVQAFIAMGSAAVMLGYFAWFEARDGRTPGKRALDLRVVRLDGQPMTYRESIIRNLAKLSPPLLLLDTLVMLIAFRREKQRVSDKLAETIVVRT